MSTAKMYHRLYISVLIATEAILAIYTMALILSSLGKPKRCVWKSKNTMEGTDFIAHASGSN